MGAIIRVVILLLLLCSPAWGETYYVDANVTDTNVGSATPDSTTYNPATKSTSGGSASVYSTYADVNAKAFSSGSVVYWDSSDTWSSADGSVLVIDSDGVTYDGSSWGGGTRAKIEGNGDGVGVYASLVLINKGNVTFKGFEVDGNAYNTYGIWVGGNLTTDIDNILSKIVTSTIS